MTLDRGTPVSDGARATFPIDRFPSDAQLARHAGVAQLEASSGKHRRHRLDRGGNRQLNAALYRITLCRLRWDPRTKAYAERRTTEGLSKKEIIRCLKRLIAREIYPILIQTSQHNTTTRAA